MRRGTLLTLLFATLPVSAEPKPEKFIETYCLKCHDSVSKKGGADFGDLAALPGNFDSWVRLFDRVEKKEMPPAGSRAPGEAERTAFLKSLRENLHTVSRAAQEREGRTPLRRLNRAEYQNTLHDLLGVTTDVRSLLPEDSVVGGFDKISGGLETSATHLVRYLEAADRALADALPLAPYPAEPIRVRQTGREFFDSRPKLNREGMAPFVRFEGGSIVLCATLYKHGSVATVPTPVAGRYRIRASVGAVRNAGKPIPVIMGKMSSDRFAHEKLEHLIDIQDAPGEGRRVLEAVANLNGHEQIYLEGLGLPFFHDMSKKRDQKPVGDDEPIPGLALEWIELEGPLDAGYGLRTLFGGLPRVPNRFLAATMAGQKINDSWQKWDANEFEKPDNRLRLVTRDPKGDASRLIRAFVPRAFRRPVPEATLDGYVRIATEALDRGVPLDEVLVRAYKSVLCSPDFWMLVEKPGRLDDHAIASRLSYFLWDSMPDEELLAVAARGELSKPGVLRALTERLLKHPKSARFAESFTGQWLELRKIHDMKPDAMYVEYDDLLAWSMPAETRRFFEHVLANDLPASSFFQSDWSVLNERLARHYGLPKLEGMELRRVSLPAGSPRGGIVTHASIMKLTTNATYTSPVKRGVWVLDRLLGTPPSPPPPNVAAIEPDIRGAVTIREQLAKHQSVPVCASCHRQIDPPGFALENFDVIGGWRDRYRSKEGGGMNQHTELQNYPGRKVWMARPVEAGGTSGTGESFANLSEYRQLVMRDPDQLTRNLAGKLLVYATGAPLQFADREEVERIVARVREQRNGFRALIHEVVASRVFQSK